MTKPFGAVLLATAVLGFEEDPFFLEWLADLSAAKVSGGNNRAKIKVQKSSCKRVDRDLLTNLISFFTFLTAQSNL